MTGAGREEGAGEWKQWRVRDRNRESEAEGCGRDREVCLHKRAHSGQCRRWDRILGLKLGHRPPAHSPLSLLHPSSCLGLTSALGPSQADSADSAVEARESLSRASASETGVAVKSGAPLIANAPAWGGSAGGAQGGQESARPQRPCRRPRRAPHMPEHRSHLRLRQWVARATQR